MRWTVQASRRRLLENHKLALMLLPWIMFAEVEPPLSAPHKYASLNQSYIFSSQDQVINFK